MAVNSDKLREVRGNFVTGVTVITLPTDPPHGMTASAFSSVSLDPPLCLVCIDHGTQTYDYLTGGVNKFCVNILSNKQQDVGKHFAGMSEHNENLFEIKSTRTGVTGAPIFEDGLAYLDCIINAAHEAGDHTIFIGRVEATDIQRPEAKPLGFFRSQWLTSVE